jgi:hypothetical protein
MDIERERARLVAFEKEVADLRAREPSTAGSEDERQELIATLAACESLLALGRVKIDEAAREQAAAYDEPGFDAFSEAWQSALDCGGAKESRPRPANPHAEGTPLHADWKRGLDAFLDRLFTDWCYTERLNCSL